MSSRKQEPSSSPETSFEGETNSPKKRTSLVCILGVSSGVGLVAIAATILAIFCCCKTADKHKEETTPTTPDADYALPEEYVTNCAAFVQKESVGLCAKTHEITGLKENADGIECFAPGMAATPPTGVACSEETCCEKEPTSSGRGGGGGHGKLAAKGIWKLAPKGTLENVIQTSPVFEPKVGGRQQHKTNDVNIVPFAIYGRDDPAPSDLWILLRIQALSFV